NCPRELKVADPLVDKSRLERHKGGVLKECYSWILDNPEFLQWKNGKGNANSLLWINGGPGKGKTMMMLGLAEQLSNESQARVRPSPWLSRMLKPPPERTVVLYFFCQNTLPSHKSAVSVFNGLISLLVAQNRDLLQTKYDEAMEKAFDNLDSLR